MSRCQPLGCSSRATSSAVVALPSLGIAGLISLGRDPPDPAAIDAAGDVHVLEDLGARKAAPSISSRYMSTTQRHPSGAFAICTGRKKLSREARNSRPGSASGPSRAHRLAPESRDG